MRISAIVAMSENRVIGYNNQLLWHLPTDLQHFKAVTMAHPILMGRKTYQSIGRALPGRCNVVITQDITFQASRCLIAHSIDAALTAVASSEEVFVIGGATLYKQMLPLTQRIYLTIVHHTFIGDAYFPMLNSIKWKELNRIYHAADERNEYAFSFVTLQRCNNE